MRKYLMGGLVLVPIAALTIGVAAPAFAGTAKPVTCTAIKGKITGKNATVSGCTPLAGTGGTGKAPISALSSGSGTITWNATGTTTVDNGSLSSVTGGSCPAGTSEYSDTLDVTGGTGKAEKKILSGWVMNASVCINSLTGKITIAPGTDVTIAPPAG